MTSSSVSLQRGAQGGANHFGKVVRAPSLFFFHIWPCSFQTKRGGKGPPMEG